MTTTTPKRPQSTHEIIETMTGHDERHLEQMTGMTFDAMTQRGEVSKLTRGLIAIQLMRDAAAESKKLTWQAAWQQVLEMSRTELNTFFTEDEDPSEAIEGIGPVTEVGKDGQPSKQRPPRKRASASSRA